MGISAIRSPSRCAIAKGLIDYRWTGAAAATLSSMGPLSAAVAELCRRVGGAHAAPAVDALSGPFRLAVFAASVAARKGCTAALAELLTEPDWEILEVGGPGPRHGVHGMVVVVPPEPAAALAAVRASRLAVPDVAAPGVLVVLERSRLDSAAERPLLALVGGVLRPGDSGGLRAAVQVVFGAHRDELAAAAAVAALRRVARTLPAVESAALLDGIDGLLDAPVAQPLRLLPARSVLRTGVVKLSPDLAPELDSVADLRGGPLDGAELERVAGRALWWAELAESGVAPQLARVAEDVALGYGLAAADARARTPAALRARRDALLASRREAVRGDQPRLRTEIAKARLSIGVELTRQLGELQRAGRSHVDRSNAIGRRRVPALIAEALGVVTADLSWRLEAVAAELAPIVGVGHLVPEVAAVGAPAVPPEPTRGRPAGEDRLLLLTGASGGLGIARLAVLPAVGLPALLGPSWVPLSVGLAIGAAGWLFRAHRHAAECSRMSRWLVETLAQARADFDAVVAHRLIDIEHRLSVAASAAGDERLAGIERELREVDRQLRRQDSEETRQR
ncbi:MAG: dynamin [Pseudonocardia sp.]|nr:dynamin [Pseudonocardia sp.]